MKLDIPRINCGPRFKDRIVVAVDTETTAIAKDKLSWNGKSRIAAPSVPQLVVGSVAYSEGEAYCLSRDSLLVALDDALSARRPLVFHNLAFDFFVIDQADPRIGARLLEAIGEGRVYDTMNRELLIQIAEGRQTFGTAALRLPSLATSVQRRCGMTLTKDDDTRLGFDKYVGRPYAEIPDQLRTYAARDAWATLALFAAQEPVMAALHAEGVESPYPVLPDAVQRFGYLSEHIQAQGAVALQWLEGFPLRVDLAEVKRRRKEIWAEFCELQEKLITFGWARRAPRTKKFHLSLKAVREALTAWAKQNGVTPELTDSGLLKLDRKFWSPLLPREQDDSLAGRLASWLRFGALQKIISTYLDCYETSDEHYTHYWNLMTRTTRTSSVRPNVQNIPKHKDNLRGLFVPSPGCALVEFDFKAAELVALAEVHKAMFGQSSLADDINAGRDPHIENARRLVGPKDTVTCSPDTIQLLRACWRNEELQRLVAGSTSAQSTGGDTASSTSAAPGSLPIESPTGSGLELFLKAGSCVIPATTLRALTRTISFREQLSKTTQTWLEKAALGARGLTVAELLTHDGREVLRWIFERTEETGSAGIADVSKSARQRAKAFGFGLPGGLGAPKLQQYAARSYGVAMTLQEARETRKRFLEVNPEMREYLADHVDPENALRIASMNLGLSEQQLAGYLDALREDDGSIHYGLALTRLRAWTRGDRRYSIPAPEGFQPLYHLFRTTSASLCGGVRGRSTYTQAHNFPFQSHVACGLKRGLFNLMQEHRASGNLWRPVVQVHDSVLLEIDASIVPSDSYLIDKLAGLFREGLAGICRDVKAGVDVDGPRPRWGKTT